MNTTVQTITPEHASRLLKKNSANRKVSKKTVYFYADQMTRGVWKTTHQGIAIATDGTILDGQHRLLAIVKSGINIEMTITTNLLKDLFTVIDTGKSRSASDTISLHAPKYPTAISKGIRTMLSLKNNCNTAGCGAIVKISNLDIFNEYSKGKENYTEIVEFAVNCYKKNRLIPAGDIMGIYLHLLNIGNDEYRIKDFIEQICGVKNPEFSTLDLLKTILIKNLTARRKISPVDKFMLYKRSWNSFKSYVPLKRIPTHAVKELLFD